MRLEDLLLSNAPPISAMKSSDALQERLIMRNTLTSVFDINNDDDDDEDSLKGVLNATKIRDQNANRFENQSHNLQVGDNPSRNSSTTSSSYGMSSDGQFKSDINSNNNAVLKTSNSSARPGTPATNLWTNTTINSNAKKSDDGNSVHVSVDDENENLIQPSTIVTGKTRRRLVSECRQLRTQVGCILI
jgi:hypothetical protein